MPCVAVAGSVFLIKTVRLPSGELLLQFGPINMVIGAWHRGTLMQEEMKKAAEIAVYHLEELSCVLDKARIAYGTAAAEGDCCPCRSRPRVLAYMCDAVRQAGDPSLTPMAAVAGAIADLTVEALERWGATKAFANNGGDIAIKLTPEESTCIGIVSCLANGKISHKLTLTGRDGIGGVATSGLGGRSLTKGIADAVVVLADNARLADASATLIANETLVETAEVIRVKAEFLDPQTDLQGQMVTQTVHSLPHRIIAEALERGKRSALQLLDRGVIKGAFIFVQGEMAEVTTGHRGRLVCRINEHY